MALETRAVVGRVMNVSERLPGRSVQDGTLSTKSLRTYLRLGLLPREPECIISANCSRWRPQELHSWLLNLNTPEPMNRAVGGPHLYSVRHMYKKMNRMLWCDKNTDNRMDG